MIFINSPIIGIRCKTSNLPYLCNFNISKQRNINPCWIYQSLYTIRAMVETAKFIWGHMSVEVWETFPGGVGSWISPLGPLWRLIKRAINKSALAKKPLLFKWKNSMNFCQGIVLKEKYRFMHFKKTQKMTLTIFFLMLQVS